MNIAVTANYSQRATLAEASSSPHPLKCSTSTALHLAPHRDWCYMACVLRQHGPSALWYMSVELARKHHDVTPHRNIAKDSADYRGDSRSQMLFLMYFYQVKQNYQTRIGLALEGETLSELRGKWSEWDSLYYTTESWQGFEGWCIVMILWYFSPFSNQWISHVNCTVWRSH